MFVRGIITVFKQPAVHALFYDDAMRLGVQVIHLHAEPVHLGDSDAVVVTFEFAGDENAINSIYDEYTEKYPKGKIEIRNDYRDTEPEGETGTLGDLRSHVEARRKTRKNAAA